jgi:glucan 1,3-beta-glucosidase
MTPTSPKSGLPKPIFFERARAQYETISAAAFVRIKKNDVKGDGVTDDTAAFQRVIDERAKSGKIIFVHAGSYLLTDTIKVPPGARIVGELWSEHVASGVKFSDPKRPRVMFQVGSPGDKGTVEIRTFYSQVVGQPLV